MTRRRKVAFALLAMTLAVVFSLGTLLAADLYVHRKFQASAGVNIWGYRGPTVGRKQRGERRVVVLGESTAFGFGVLWYEAFPVALEQLLNQPQGGVAPSKVSVVNLGYNLEGAFSYPYTLADYEYLNYDVVVLYTGYPNIPYATNFATANRNIQRHRSALFRLTGYYPLLPLVMREKAMAIRYGGRLEDAYFGRPTVFRPTVAQRSTASALEAAAKVTDALDHYQEEIRRLDVSEATLVPADRAAIQCGVYAGYCEEVFLGVKYAIDRGKRVVIATQPYMPGKHREQQLVMAGYLRQRFADRVQLRFAIPGASINLGAAGMTVDGLHLSAAGNRIVAQNLLAAVRGALDGSPSEGDPPRPTLPIAAPPFMPPLAADPSASENRPPASPAPGARWTSPVDARAMVWIQPGTFQMGSGGAAHPVTMDAGFWMDTTEVSNAAYLQFVRRQPAWAIGQHGSEGYDGRYLRLWKDGVPPPAQGDYPATALPWFAARAYCTWAGKRLPTEAEWEYAARAGTTTAYWWGDQFDASHANMNMRGPETVGQPQRVNPWGLADMAGNAWEWTSSLHQPYPYRAGDGRETADAAGDERRVIRGGAWIGTAEHLRSAERLMLNPRVAADYVGFRCAEDPAAK